MGQKYKIFLRRHQFVFGENVEESLEVNLVINILNKELVKTLLSYLKKEKEPQVIHVPDPEGFDIFCSFLKLVRAAGGLTFNTDDKLLLIRRNNLWDLPKGKLDKGEDPMDGAIREVEEECSISGLTISDHLTTTYHVYYDDKWLLKRTEWYVMQSTLWRNAKPQLKENITEVKWVNFHELDIELLGTYLSIKEVLYRLTQHQEGI